MSNFRSFQTLLGLPVLFFGSPDFTHAQSSCDSKISIEEKTPGCTPSACRGAQTKFGEAKVISELRKQLIDLKAKMEVSVTHAFEERTYSVHRLLGKTDEESLQIIAEEVKIIENAFLKAMDADFPVITATENRAKMVQALKLRIEQLVQLL